MIDDIDITSDLVDGSDGILGDTVPQNAQADHSQMQAPAGTQHVHGDAQQSNANTPEQQPAKEQTLREQLSSAFKGDDGKPTDQANAQNASQQVALSKDTDGKYRLADGTFASQEQITAFEAAQNTQAQPDANAQQPQSPVIAGMTPVEQQQFQSLPAELRQFVGRTMEDLNTRAQRYGEYDLIEQIVGPRRQAFAQEGTTPAVALNQLFAMSDFAGRDPGAFVLWFSQQRNLDLDALLDQWDAAAQNVDPQVQQLQGHVQQLSSTLQQIQQQNAQAVQQQNLNAVQNFAQERDGANALKRPFITEVMDQWAEQITAVRLANPNMPNTEVLQKAYENACWNNPTVRGKMQQASQQQQQAANAARVQAARDAGSSVTGAPAGTVSTIPNNSNRTIREELESQFAAARAV